MMQIGFDAKRLYNNFTGLGNYSRTLVNNLGEFFPENKYRLYTPEIRKNKATAPFLNSDKYDTFCYKGIFKSLWRSSGIKKNLQKDKIDIFHGLSHEIPVNIHKTGIRSVVTIHDLIFLTYPDMYTAIDRAIYNRKFRYACKNADKIIAISECTKQDIMHHFGIAEEKIEVVYQAMLPAFYNMQAKETAETILQKYQLPKDYLLYVGAINSRKNLLGIVKALKLLPADFRLPLVVIGNGHGYKTEVLKYARRAGLMQQLILMDNIHDAQELQAFYQQARIFIYPSFYEGFGLPVTEALLSKVPVITSDRSCLPEAGGPDSYYVNPACPEEIARAIVSILSDDDRRLDMIEKGYLFAQEQFNPEKLTRKVHQVYQQIL